MSQQLPKGRGLSLWWLPPAALQDRLQGVVDALAQRLGTPRFMPHITVEGGLTGHPETLVTTLGRATGTHVSPQLRQVGIGTGIAWNHLLFIDFDRSPSVTQARVDVCMALNRTVAPAGFRPHLSLAYGTFDAASRDAMAQGLRLDLAPFQPVALALMDTRGAVDDWWEVHRWPLAASPGLETLDDDAG